MIRTKRFFKENFKNADLNSEMFNLQAIWKNWYKGYSRDFHNYYVSNGNKAIVKNRLTLGMAKTICENYADLLLNDKVEYNFNGKNDELIHDILNDNRFYTEANQLIEKSQALGGGAFSIELNNLKVGANNVRDYSEALVNLNYISADRIIILKEINGKVEDIAFITEKSNGEKKTDKLFIINTHEKQNNGDYLVKNYILDNEAKDITNDMLDENGVLTIDNLANEITLPFKTFAYIKPNIVNNKIDNTAYGVSAFANAIDVLKNIDLIYDSFNNEFILGKKRLFVSPDMLKITHNGEPVFDDNDMVFYYMGDGGGTGETPTINSGIKELDFNLRIQEHKSALETALDMLSSKCGLGKGYFKVDKRLGVTATEVVSNNSDLYRSVKKQELLLEESLIELFINLNNIINLKNNTKHDIEVSINFDDSIIQDTEAIKKEAYVEYNAGLIDEVEYMRITRNLTEEQAIKFVDEMRIRRVENENKLREEMIANNQLEVEPVKTEVDVEE